MTVRPDWQPSPVDDDPAGRAGGKRDPFLLEEEMREFDAECEEHGIGEFEAAQVRFWLRDVPAPVEASGALSEDERAA